MSTFDFLCETRSRSDFVDDVKDPQEDHKQDAWLSYLEMKDREVKPADTKDELRDAYQHDAGLIVKRFRYSKIDEYRKRTRGQKDTLIVPLHDDDGNMVEIADDRSERAFRAIEAHDELVTFARQATPRQRKALKNFLQAYKLQEQGLPVPTKLQSALSRDRNDTGLALKLVNGRGALG